MSQVKVATFNVEWLVSAFGALWKDWQAPGIPAMFPGKKLGDLKLEPIADVPGLLTRLAGVIQDIQADIIGLQEAPPLKEQMEVFVKQYLNDDYVVYHSNSRWQSVSSLVRKSAAAQVSPWVPGQPPVPEQWKNLYYYPWGTFGVSARKKHEMYRHPLLLKFTPLPGKELGLMVLHTKSKYSKLKKKEQWENREPEAMVDALDARTKLSAEVFCLRQFFNLTLDAAPEASLIVMGDFNDGPYAETLEKEFLIHNILDELVGSILYPQYYFRHAMEPETLKNAKTVNFPDPLENDALVWELIDHLLVSPAIWQKKGDFSVQAGTCQVETAVYDSHNDDTGLVRQRGLRPSDHRPVSVILEY